MLESSNYARPTPLWAGSDHAAGQLWLKSYDKYEENDTFRILRWTLLSDMDIGSFGAE